MGGTEASDEVVFEGAHSAFGCIDSVVVGFNELEARSGLVDGTLDRFGGLFVEDVELGLEAVIREDAVELLVGSEGFCVTAVFHGLHEDAIAVVVIEDQHVFVACL